MELKKDVRRFLPILLRCVAAAMLLMLAFTPTTTPARVAGRSLEPKPARAQAGHSKISDAPEELTTPSTATPGEANNSLVSKRVGIQAGHWQIDNVPDELSGLDGDWGAVVGNVWEVDVNLNIAKRVASLLEAHGIAVDLIPATVPVGYKADAFVALHADQDPDPDRSGYKIARASASAIPPTDDALLNAIAREYQAATHMMVDPNVSDDMTDYYAFNYRRFDHAIAPTTPAVILEMGFLTNASDLQILLNSPDVVAGAIARGIIDFLT